MGFSFSRSVKFGPLRVNVSTRGVGLSAGVKGARVGIGPRGTFVTLGRGGFRYQTRLGAPATKSSAVGRQPELQHELGPADVQGRIETASIDALIDASPDQVLSEINFRTHRFSWWRPYLIVSVLWGLFSGLNPVVLILLLVGGVFVYRWDHERRTVQLVYDIDDDALVSRWSLCNAAGEALSRTERLWHIYATEAVRDGKRHAGAEALVARTRTSSQAGSLEHISLNVEPWSIRVGPQQLLFLPDRLLVHEQRKFAAIPYEQLSVEVKASRFIEEELVPADARKVGTTWRFVNKDGGPDLRFNNNVQLPVMEYGQLTLSSPSGLVVVLEASNTKAVGTAKAALEALREPARTSSNLTPQQTATPPKSATPPTAAPPRNAAPATAAPTRSAVAMTPAPPRSAAPATRQPAPPAMPVVRLEERTNRLDSWDIDDGESSQEKAVDIWDPRYVAGSHGGTVDASVRADDFWIPAGRSVQVHGLSIPGGMTYVGKGLGAVRGYGGLEPALIDPSAKVNLKRPDTKGEGLDYWPGYSRIPEATRGAYLLWLAGGRCAPDTPIGFVFLFFYGLERRIISDARVSAVARAEAPGLIAEVARLLSIYGEHNSFRRYARSLLAAAQVVYPQCPLSEITPPRTRQGFDLPIDLLAGIGERLVLGKPITGPWAFAWYINSPDARLRTPAHRCAAEFEKLFLLRYDQKYPEGLKVKPNQKKLTCEYHAASSGLAGCEFPVGDLPDVRGIGGPMKKFSEIADACMSELDAYSRLLGKNPQAAGTAQSVALLPAELGAGRASDQVGRLGQELSARMADAPNALVDASVLMAHWDHTDPEKLSKKEATGFALLLERLGIGLEPDVRFGGPSLNVHGKAVIFRLGSMRMGQLSREYSAAATLMHVSAVVAAADGGVSADEEIHLERHLENAMHLNEAETDRLRAHLRWLLSEPPGIAGLKKKLEELPQAMRRQIAGFATSVAGADGRIDPAEVRVLQKLYAMLGFAADDVFSDIHALAAAPAVRPVTVSLGQQGASGRAIPAPPLGATTPAAHLDERGFTLDMERVQAKMKDTAEVASLLSEIFEEPEAEAAPAPPEPQAEDGLAGLDAVHTELLLALEGASELTRVQFEQLCDVRSLMSGAAFELLNEAAFARCEAPLLIGDDPIEVDQTILTEMCS